MNIIEKRTNNLLENNINFYIDLTKKHIKNQGDFIVSLTSFPARIDHVWKTIISLKLQTITPKKIILWLSLEEFPDKNIPDSLNLLQDEVFEVRFVEGNLISHKKYFYAFQEFKEDIIITTDDDMYYHRNTLKFLIDKHNVYPNCVISNRVRKISLRKDDLKPYNKWKENHINPNDKDLFQIGVDGVLYPPGQYREKELLQQVFMELAPIGDDIWLNAMARFNCVDVKYSGFKYRNIPTATLSPSLESINVKEGKNDSQLGAVRNYFLTKFGKDIYLPLK